MAQKSAKKNRLGIVLVTYGEGKGIKRILDIIQKEKQPGDKVSLIDNHPDHETAKVAEKHPAVEVTIRSPENLGYVGNNAAAKEIQNDVDILLFLNPDSMPEKGSITKLRNGPEDWAGWMGLLVLPDGKVNSAGNVIHISGLSWVSGFGDDASKYQEPQEVTILSGADLAIRVSEWKKTEGFGHIYFIYYEDSELSTTMIAMGKKIGMLPQAKIGHNYSFYNSPRKWFLLERNRYLYIIRNWPLGVILVLLPLLIFVELGLWAVAILQRRFILKVKSTYSFFKLLPAAGKSRRGLQRLRKISALEYYDMLEPRIETPLLPSVLRSAPVNWIFIGYYKFARIILSFFSPKI